MSLSLVTDKGISMISLLLKTKIAVQLSIDIMNIIVRAEKFGIDESKMFNWL